MAKSKNQSPSDIANNTEHYWQRRFSRVFEEAARHFQERQAQRQARQGEHPENHGGSSPPPVSE